MTKLTPKQTKFCEEYLIDFNGTQAAIRAGYSSKTAHEQAAQLLAKLSIQALIQELRQSQQERTQVSADSVIEKLWSIAGFELNQVGTFDGKKMIFKPESEWAESARTAVRNLKQTTTTSTSRNGDEIRTDVIELKIEPKLPVLDALARHLGLFDNFNAAIATLKTYGIVISRDDNNDWTIEKGRSL
jgi:phage terminase small subunit